MSSFVYLPRASNCTEVTSNIKIVSSGGSSVKCDAWFWSLIKTTLLDNGDAVLYFSPEHVFDGRGMGDADGVAKDFRLFNDRTSSEHELLKRHIQRAVRQAAVPLDNVSQINTSGYVLCENQDFVINHMFMDPNPRAAKEIFRSRDFHYLMYVHVKFNIESFSVKYEALAVQRMIV